MADSEIPKGLIRPIDHTTLGHAHSHIMGSASFTPNTMNPLDLSNFIKTPTEMPSPVINIDPAVKRLVEIKQHEYAEKARKFMIVHYASLSLGAVLGIVTPFIIPSQPFIAQLTSVLVVLLISFDQIFKPKEKWALYSKATDLLQLQLFQKSGSYEQNKELIDTIINTESQILTAVPGLNEVLQQVQGKEKR